jgi:hypothetical protein
MIEHHHRVGEQDDHREEAERDVTTDIGAAKLSTAARRVRRRPIPTAVSSRAIEFTT